MSGSHDRGEVALVLSGGGARAAYQVGVMRALADVAPDLRLPIITGVSAGAINAVLLASHEGTFRESVADLCREWSALTAGHVFAVRPWELLRAGIRSLLHLAGLRTPARRPSRGVLDITPLCHTLVGGVDLAGIDRNIRAGRLKAVALSATSYTTGSTVTFVEGADSVETWQRAQRVAVKSRLTMDHVLASAAIPLVFQAIRLDGHYYGDGSVRQTAPLAPAIHLGAHKVIAISMRSERSAAPVERITGYPSPSDMLAMLFHSVFLDALDADAERLERFNELIGRMPREPGAPEGLRRIELLMLRPSRDVGDMARGIRPDLPWLMRPLLRSVDQDCGPDFMSYLLFEREFIGRLVELGYEDGRARRGEIERFLEQEPDR